MLLKRFKRGLLDEFSDAHTLQTQWSKQHGYLSCSCFERQLSDTVRWVFKSRKNVKHFKKTIGCIDRNSKSEINRMKREKRNETLKFDWEKDKHHHFSWTSRKMAAPRSSSPYTLRVCFSYEEVSHSSKNSAYRLGICLLSRSTAISSR